MPSATRTMNACLQSAERDMRRVIDGIANHETDNMAWLRRAGQALRERPELRADHIEGKDNG
ncbi:MAG: hypothetical protein V4657_13480 [Pseudomonadota bacterium]